jgi:transcriptional regulator of heat shock response
MTIMLTNRQEKLLNIIIDNYIKTAEPVSSKALVDSRLFDLSSATIRNEMHGLEECGFLIQLHTSGGRVPTDRGYRFYVDNLVNEDDFGIQPNWQKKVDAVLAHMSYDPRDINKTVAQLLADLSDNIVIAGIAEEDDFYKTGLASLFELPEFQEINKVFRLTSFFDEFDRVFKEIEKEFFRELYGARNMNGINVIIGRENRHPSIRDETVMTVKYNLPDQLVGSLTIIGPTRMDYKKNIGLVKYTTDKINKIVTQI